MSVEIGVKREYKFPISMCKICLCSYRKLSPLGIHKTLYYNLLRFMNISLYPHQAINSMEEIMVCWQCLAALRHTSELMNLLIKTQSLFDTGGIAFDPNLLLPQQLWNLEIAVKDKYDLEISHAEQIASVEEPVDKKEIDIEIHELNLNIKTELPQQDADFCDIDSYNNSENDYMEAEDINSCHGIEDFYAPEIDTKPVKVKIKKEKSKKKSKHLYKEEQESYDRDGENKKYRLVTDDNIDQDVDVTKVMISMDEYMKMREMYKEKMDRHESKYKCQGCLLSFATKKFMVQHNQAKHNERNKIECEICTVRVASKSELDSHYKSHRTCYKCTACGYMRHSKLNIYAHVRVNHKKKWECLVCFNKFDGRVKFYNHYKEVHKDQQKGVSICDYCGRKYKKKKTLAHHIEIAHSPLECTICALKFNKRTTMITHKRIKHSKASAKETAYCVECDKQFDNIYQYRKHLSVSLKHKKKEGQPKFPCEECGKIFSRKKYMKYHFDLVHLKKTKYYCEQCDKYFARADGLRGHIQGVHLGVRLPKNIFCEICGRGFQTKAVLVKHVRTHTGERPFACEYCPATFTQKTPRDNHVKHIHLKIGRDHKYQG